MLTLERCCDECRSTTLTAGFGGQSIVHAALVRSDGSLHIWIGPAGLHLFWPDIRASRPDWCRSWAA